MNIIQYRVIGNNIGIDIGNSIMLPILENHNSIPCSNTISLNIPETMKEYKILLYIGNNKLSKNNKFIDEITIVCPYNKVYIEFILSDILYINNLLLVKIKTKTKLIAYYIIQLPISFSYDNICIDNCIDIYNYRLKFELIQCIDTIRNKIKNNVIILSCDTIILLEEKINQIISNIDNYNNQKLLDIKKNLCNKFFI